MDNKLSELSKPIGVSFKSDIDLMKSGRMIHGQMTVWKSTVGIPDSQEGVYSQEYVSALLERISELEWRELNSTELKELLTWHPTERSAATDPTLWAAMRNKINLTRIRVAGDEAKKEQSNG